MTRVTLGELKKAARNPSLRRQSGGASTHFPTPMPTAMSAVRRFHRDGADAAITHLNGVFDRSAYWGPTGQPQARGWADAIRQCLQTYVDLASVDDRPALSSPVTTNVQVGENSIGVSPDVVLLDSGGYVGRYLLWDTPHLEEREAELLATPVVLALQQELGANRVVGAEIWHLRSGRQVFVDTATALTRLGEVEAIITDYSS